MAISIVMSDFKSKFKLYEVNNIKRKIGTGVRVGLASGKGMIGSAYKNRDKLGNVATNLGKFGKDVLGKGISTGKSKYQNIKTSK